VNILSKNIGVVVVGLCGGVNVPGEVEKEWKRVYRSKKVFLKKRERNGWYLFSDRTKTKWQSC
jgi:hypothetical protein